MVVEQFGKITLIQGDCEVYMKTLSPFAFDLAIVDPPYGIGMDGGSMSIALAAHDLKFELTVIEKDAEYYVAARKRIIEHQKILSLW